MSASEKDLNNLSHVHSGSNTVANAGTGGSPANQDTSNVTYYGHSQSQPPVTLQHTPQSNTHPVSHPAPTNKPSSQGQKPPSSQKSQSGQPSAVKPSATTNVPVVPPKTAPTPTPPGSSAVLAAVMAQAQAAAGQAVAAQQAKQQAPNSSAQQPVAQPSTQPVAPPPGHPIPGQQPQPYPYPYPYYLPPPGQPGAPPYMYPGAPGAPAFIPTGTTPQAGAPPPGYPYMYPMYPAPIPVPQTSPVPSTKEKKSQRTYQACQKCRQWKAKCNGLKPCNHCQKRGVPCEYAERRNMSGPSESNQGEQAGSQEEAPPGSLDVASGSKTMDPKPTSDVSPNAAQPTANFAPGIDTAQQPQTQPPQPQVAPQTTSPPHSGQPQHPPPMAMYPPPPPGYAYPPQIYPGMPFPQPGDPNAPYAHFMGMQYPQPYGPYLWGPPPPPPGHEQAPAPNPAEGEDGERDADGKLKIKRTFQACQKCRQRKAKCNGARPSCQHCTARGLACEYAKERSKPRGSNGEEGEESSNGHSQEAPTTMDPSQAMTTTMNPSSTSPGVPPPGIFPPPFPYDPSTYNPHVDPQQHGAQPMYPFPPYAYSHAPGFGTIAGPPLVHIGEEGAVAPYHPAVPQPVPVAGPPQPNTVTTGPSNSNKRPRAARPPGAPGTGKVRIFQACERCRERKAKCDGVRPICTHCAARDLNCEWAGKRRMRGPAKGITPRRTRSENSFTTNGTLEMNNSMPGLPIGINAAGLQTIEQHPPTNPARKRKRRASHSSGSPSPTESSSSSESSPSESDDDDQHSGMGAGSDGMAGVVAGQWA